MQPGHLLRPRYSFYQRREPHLEVFHLVGEWTNERGEMGWCRSRPIAYLGRPSTVARRPIPIDMVLSRKILIDSLSDEGPLAFEEWVSEEGLDYFEWITVE